MKKNYGFKGGKKLSVYVGVSQFGAPRPECIEGLKSAWNSCNEKWFLNSKREVKRITIQKLKPRYGIQIVAKWQGEKGKIIVNDTGVFSKEVFEVTLLHEAAHAWYHKQTRLSPEAVEDFKNEVLRLAPINQYTLRNRGKWSEELYANEIHSAVVEALHNKNVFNLVGSEENLESAIQAYKKLHERC